MAPVRRWTGVEAKALRQAMRLSVREFAEHTGVDRRTVNKWDARGSSITLLPDTQRLMDSALRLADDEVRARFDAAARPAATINTPSAEFGSTPHASPAIIELRDALTDYGFRSAQSDSTHSDGIPSPHALERDLDATFNAYQQSRFTSAASRVSTLLPDVQLATREYKGAQRTKAFGILALSYQAAASVLTKAGLADLAWIAAERGLNAAKSTDSSAVQGSLIRSVAFAMLSTGHLEPAMRLIETGANHLEAEITKDDTVLSVYGMLFLAGAMAAARFGDGPKAADYLQEATNAARRLGTDANHLWTAFGPTNVAIHRVNTAAELGDMQTVLDTGPSLNTDAVPTETARTAPLGHCPSIQPHRKLRRCGRYAAYC